MMNIFQIIFHNYTSPVRTRTPEEKVPYPVDFRGELNHKANLCTLCGTCAYVCSPVAINITREAEHGAWEYDGGRCTFCGKCVEYCPTKALGFQNQSAPIVNRRSLEFKVDMVEYQRCKRCGATIIPLPVETLARLYHSEEAAQHALKVHELCERCRRQVHSQSLKLGISGRSD
jgi:formate hydrogenlyase subunit 6/NADH:ubiquinone oxidoreductase subunit I